MTHEAFTIAGVLEKLSEFERVASVLAMPLDERLGILNVSEVVYTALQAGNVQRSQAYNSELARRLSYALPLMRKLAANMPAIRPAQPAIGQAAA